MMPHRPVRHVLGVSAASLATVAIVAWTHTPSPVAAADPKPPAADRAFDERIRPFLAQYCVTCHNSDKAAGGVTLDGYLSEAHARKDRKLWEEIQKLVAMGTMPPKKKPQPPKDEKEYF